jgi:chemotaxis response regulator CheB
MDQAADRSDIVAIGESVGGVSAISTLLGQLLADLNASVMIALHRPADPASYLRGILERATKLHVKAAEKGEAFGALGDGPPGLKTIKGAAGVALVQCPSEADLPQMPENAIAYDGAIDLVAPIDVLAKEILSRTGRSLMQAPAGP